MQRKDTKLDFSGQEIYVGVDLGKKDWKVCILTKDFSHKAFSQPPDPKVLVGYLRKHFPGAKYLCAYEAGCFGFWIYYALKEMGVDCLVVHPADVPTMDKERRNRNDRVDARKLARNVRNGDLNSVYVPTQKALEDRSLVRMRLTMVKKQTRCKNQIKSHLDLYGHSIPDELEGRRWSGSFIDWLGQLEFYHETGKQSLQALLGELSYLRQNIAGLTKQLRVLSREEAYRSQLALLETVPGIGFHSAMVFLTEIVDINRFKNLDHLASYAGLAPGENSSGEQERVTGITHRRNAYLRYLLVECSWRAIRDDPALLMSYQKFAVRMHSNKAIIRIARKLLNRVRYVLKNQQPYEICVVS